MLVSSRSSLNGLPFTCLPSHSHSWSWTCIWSFHRARYRVGIGLLLGSSPFFRLIVLLALTSSGSLQVYKSPDGHAAFAAAKQLIDQLVSGEIVIVRILSLRPPVAVPHRLGLTAG